MFNIFISLDEHLDSTFPLSSITEADTEITSEQARGIPEIIIGTGNRENQQNYSTTDLGGNSFDAFC